MAKASKTTRGVVLTLIGGTCWGFSGTCAKFLMDGYGVDPVWLVCVRQFFASWLFLALAAAVPGDRKRLRDLVRELGRGWRTLALVAVTAACMMVNSVCYIVTVKVTNSATATVLQTLALVVLMVYSCVTARRGPRRRELAGLALALGGTFLIATGGDPAHLAMPAAGLAWGLATCVTYALYSAVPEGLLKRWGSPAVNGVTMLVSGTVLLVATRPWEGMPAFDAAGGPASWRSWSWERFWRMRSTCRASRTWDRCARACLGRRSPSRPPCSLRCGWARPLRPRISQALP